MDEEKGRSNGTKNSNSSKLSHVLGSFRWPWFALPMATGSLSVAVAQQPYTFPGLRTIGKVYFILCLVIWIVFSMIMLLRFIVRPKDFSQSLHAPTEALFFGTYWVTIALLLNCMQQYGVPNTGPWLVQAMEVLFWIYLACALIVAILQYSTIFVKEQIPVASAVPAWVFPAYPFLVTGSLAGAMISSQPPASALRIFVAGIVFQGAGWMISIFMYTIYITRMMSGELPPASSRPGMMIGVGPAGYTAAALVQLGNTAPNAIPAIFLEMNGADVASTLKVVGVFAGAFLWLLAFWFCALGVVAIFNGVRQMHFTLTWWAFIFPNVGLTLATIQIGNVFESPAIKAVASAMTIVLVCLWFFVFYSLVRSVWRSGKLPDQ